MTRLFFYVARALRPEIAANREHAPFSGLSPLLSGALVFARFVRTFAQSAPSGPKFRHKGAARASDLLDLGPLAPLEGPLFSCQRPARRHSSGPDGTYESQNKIRMPIRHIISHPVKASGHSSANAAESKANKNAGRRRRPCSIRSPNVQRAPTNEMERGTGSRPHGPLRPRR